MNVSRHRFTSPKSDGPDATLVQPSKWNEEHDIGMELTNRTGGELVAGDIVGLSDSFDESVVLADSQDTIRTLVVALETVADGATGLFESTGSWPVKVNSATARGRYLAKSTTTKALYDTGVSAAAGPPPTGAVAISITSSGGAGTVVAFMLTAGSGGSGGVLFNGGSVASAATLPVGNSGALFRVTGTTTITSISERPVGHLLLLVFDDVLQLTHNGTSLMLQGGKDYVTAAGEVLFLVSEGSGNWRQGAPMHEVLNYVWGTQSVRVGASPAQSGEVRIPSGGFMTGRNVADDGDIPIVGLDSSDRVTIGAANTIRVNGILRADIESGARVVLPVGVDKWAE